MPSVERLINFCEYFKIPLSNFFDEEYVFPVEYSKIIHELDKMDIQEIEQIYGILKLINSKRV